MIKYNKRYIITKTFRPKFFKKLKRGTVIIPWQALSENAPHIYIDIINPENQTSFAIAKKDFYRYTTPYSKLQYEVIKVT
jgi:hypothetical protein